MFVVWLPLMKSTWHRRVNFTGCRDRWLTTCRRLSVAAPAGHADPSVSPGLRSAVPRLVAERCWRTADGSGPGAHSLRGGAVAPQGLNPPDSVLPLEASHAFCLVDTTDCGSDVAHDSAVKFGGRRSPGPVSGNPTDWKKAKLKRLSIR
jgi:hypothetical protein